MFVEIFHRLFVCVFCLLQGGEVNVPDLIAKTARTGGISVRGVPVNGVGFNASNMKFCRERCFFGVLTQLLKVVFMDLSLVFLTLNRTSFPEMATSQKWMATFFSSGKASSHLDTFTFGCLG